MEIIVTIALFLNRYGLFLFLISLVLSLYGSSQLKKGNVDRASKCFKWAAISAFALAGGYGAVFLLVHDGFSLLLAGLWGYFGWRDWKHYRLLRS